MNRERGLDSQVGQAQREGRDGAGRGHPRQCTDFLQGLAEEVHARLVLGLTVPGEHLQRNRVRRREAQVHVHQPPEALQEQARADQQHQREGNLDRHQQTAHPLLRDGCAGALRP